MDQSYFLVELELLQDVDILIASFPAPITAAIPQASINTAKLIALPQSHFDITELSQLKKLVGRSELNRTLVSLDDFYNKDHWLGSDKNIIICLYFSIG